MGRRLSNKVVSNLPVPEKGNRITYDAPNGGGKDWTPGFGVRVTAGGGRSFVFNYRCKGTERRITIGSPPAWTVEAARKEAADLKFRVGQGEDPLAAIRAGRDAPTVADLCERFIEEHLKKLRPSTQRSYRVMLKEIRTALGAKKVASVDYEHIDRLHREISKRAPFAANRTTAVLSRMFNLAIRWKLRADNPCKGVERNAEQGRKRYLSADELARLTKALDEHPNQQAANIFRLLLLTGARSGEVLSATWDQLDLETGVWTKPASTTKQKQDHVVPLSAPARQLLARIRRKQDETETFVFPNGHGHHRRIVKQAWRQICKEARITGLRVHDLRHSFASHLASGGASLPLIGSLLGHSNPTTTSRYAHLFNDPQRAAVERVGAILSGKKKAPVVPLRGRR